MLSLECLTNAGDDPGVKCISKWTYINVTYNGCANPHNDPNGNWCPTDVNNDTAKFESRSGKWGYCSDNCPIDPGINSKYISREIIWSVLDFARL